MALVTLFASCGIPSDDEPRPVTLGSPPIDANKPSTTLAASADTVIESVFLVKLETEAKREILAKVDREMNDNSPQTVLETLFSTTNSADDEEDLRNLLTGLTFTDLTITDEENGFATATIDLPKESAVLFVDQTRLIAAQIVVTLTNLPATAGHGRINKVWFKLDGKANLIVDGNGKEISAATRKDYAFLDPDSPQNRNNDD